MNDKSSIKKGPEYFDHKSVEEKWRGAWERAKLDVTDISLKRNKKKFYNLMMFPYPSAEGLHVGNVYAFTGSDIFGRFKRMQGLQVFEPMGLDGFGIHSENYALKVGRHPMDQAIVAERNFYKQLHRIGAMFDWSRTVETYDPEYYKWTQWLFIQMFKHDLAYRSKAEVNFCPKDKTVLADEQVIDGRCERCGNLVEKKMLEQWFFKITAYAEKLLENLNSLDWPAVIKTAQRTWIGKKEGINITYQVIDEKENKIGDITCFTTRPDTNFGATFVVLAPEHPFITQVLEVIKSKRVDTISRYVEEAKKKSREERITDKRGKTGVFTGLFCVNPLNHYKMPLFVSDFVVMDVGTGAVVGVPGHDKRDFEFAQKMKLPVIRVVTEPDGKKSEISKIDDVWEEEGTIINSSFLDGLDVNEAKNKIINYLEDKGWGESVTTFHLRNWLISRQRYWGPPIPMIYCKECAAAGRSWFSTPEASSTKTPVKAKGKAAPKITSENLAAGWYPVPEDELPVLLPRIPDYKPGDDGVAPLAKHKEFYETTCPGCGAKAVRETDVSDTFLDSSWYFLKYPSVQKQNKTDSGKNFFGDARNVSSQSLNQTTPSLNESSSPKQNSQKSELSGQTFSAPQKSYPHPSSNLPWDPAITKNWLPVDMYTGGAEHSVLHLMYSRFVTMALHDWGYLSFEEPFTRFFAHGLIIKDGAKMSKSKGNVVNPDEYLDHYGADALRLYLMFMGPFSEGGDFRDAAMEGMSRWVGRVWRMALVAMAEGKTSNQEIKSALNKLVQKVTDDLEKRRYNTAIASMMEFTNLVADENGALGLTELKVFTKLLAPFAPFITEEIWQRIQQDFYKVAEVVNENFGPSREAARKVSSGQNGSWVRAGQNFIGSPQLLKDFNSVHLEPWPDFDSKAVKEQFVTIVIQVNGKMRDSLVTTAKKANIQKEIESQANSLEKIQKLLEGKKIIKTIFVPGRIINFVVS